MRKYLTNLIRLKQNDAIILKLFLVQYLFYFALKLALYHFSINYYLINDS
jgi:hypothetical protein